MVHPILETGRIKVSVIIVNHGDTSLIRNCIASFIRAVRSTTYEIIVVDNSSDDSLGGITRLFPHLRMIRLGRNQGFGRANNIGAEHARGEYLFFLNNDTLVREDFLSPLVRTMNNNPKIGAIGPQLLNADGSFQLSFGTHVGLWGEAEAKWRAMHLSASDPGVRRQTEEMLLRQNAVKWLTGAAFMVPRSLFTKVGGFDPAYFMYFEDMDLCCRIGRVGYQIWFEPSCALTHFKGESVRKEPGKISVEYRRSQLLFYFKNRKRAEYQFIRLYLWTKYGIHFCFKPGQRTFTKQILELVSRPKPFCQA